jgi:CTP:molybdopterin cytidylyltransferase MocA
MPLYALVPAAGRGERFGSAKLLARWRDRELLGHVLTTLSGARIAGLIARTFVVHRADDAAIPNLASEYLAWPVPVKGPDGSLADSLRTGVGEIRSLDSGREDSAILICLGDQPLLRLDVIQALNQAWRSGHRAVRPSYRDEPGTPGHPLLVDHSLWHLAAEASGETGFGPVLVRHRIAVHTFAVAGHNPDIDTPGDLQALETRESSGV